MFLIAPLLPKPEFDWNKHVEIVEQACRDANITLDRAARIYGVSPQQFSQQIRGIGHVSVPRVCSMVLDRDGKKFFRSYCLGMAAMLGFDDVAQIYRLGLACAEAMSGLQVKMLKAELRERDNEDEVA
jgi:hypothetical protein